MSYGDPAFVLQTDTQNWTEASVHNALRSAVLEEDLLWNRAVRTIHAWNITRTTGPNLGAPARLGAPQGARAHDGLSLWWAYLVFFSLAWLFLSCY